MNDKRRKKLEKHGYSVCCIQEFLNLSHQEKTLIEFKLKIYNIKLSKQWIKERIDKPNSFSKNVATVTHKILYMKNDLNPTNIAPIKDGGIYLLYKISGHKLEIEIYNDGDVAAIISKNKEIIHDEDIHNMDFTFLIKKIKTIMD